VLSLLDERGRPQDDFLRAHEGMLADRLRPAAALRAAQVAMWKEKRAPYFLAAFALQGEWR
jgi:CHAT domain-containing protein